MNKTLSIFNQLSPVTVGFNSILDNFERIFEDDCFRSSFNYPDYDVIKKNDNLYDVELALAGFNKKDIKIEYSDNKLSIESIKNNKVNERDANENFIRKGTAKRFFKKTFSIANNVEVGGAELKDGLLKISLKRFVPEAKKPKTIDIK